MSLLLEIHPVLRIKRHNSLSTEFKKGQFAKEKHPKWKGGKPKCIDCGIETKDYQSKRCEPCSRIDRKLNPRRGWSLSEKCKSILSNNAKKRKGLFNPNWKGGAFCVDCNKKITRGHQRCCKCGRILAAKKISGENHPSWKGGISKEPYSQEWTELLKEKIRKRDNYQCHNCHITEEEHLMVFGKLLSVHHIDYDKFNCNGTNLITACSSCNTRFNFNRNYWKKSLCQI